MKKSDNIVSVVLFKINKKKIEDYINSIIKQRNQNFDFLIVTEIKIPKIFNKIKNNKIILKGKKNNIVYNRQILLNYINRKNYTNIIFTDIDDVYNLSRFAINFKYLKNYDFVINDINFYINNQNNLNWIKKNIDKKNINIEDIIYKNFAGFTNTALKVKLLKNLKIPKNLIAIDWYIFTIALINANSPKFITYSHSKYSVNTNNYNTVNYINYNNQYIKCFSIINKVKHIHYNMILKYLKNKNKKLMRKKYLNAKEINNKEKIKINHLMKNINLNQLDIKNFNKSKKLYLWWEIEL